MGDEESSKVWVVVPIGYQYNDIFYVAKSFSLPIACFSVKELAEEWVREQSISDFKNIAPNPSLSGYYCSNNSGEEFLNKIYLKWKFINKEDFSIEDSILQKMSDEDVLELMNDIGLKFYFICSVKIYC